MRDSETQQLVHSRALFEQTGNRFHAMAMWGAFIFIAAVLFGTLAYRPF